MDYAALTQEELQRLARNINGLIGERAKAELARRASIPKPRRGRWKEFDPPAVRVFRHARIDDLEEFFDLVGAHPEQVSILFHELIFRRSKRAISLRERVSQRIDELRQAFRWPTTNAPGSNGSSLGTIDWEKTGLLKFLGYHVGTNGLDEAGRQEVLDIAFASPLPHVNSSGYVQEFDSPGTAQRLQKLAESIAAFARNGKRKGGLGLAVEHWEADLDYLHRKYYRGKFGFDWPGT